MTKNQRLEKFARIDLYPVITEALCAGRSGLNVCEAALDGGVEIVQLREKEISKRDLYAKAMQFRTLTAQYGALLIINDYVDIALAVGADGVHLGLDDLPLEAARVIAPELVLGASTHSREEALLAEQAGADYVNIGPVFPTATKQVGAEALGVNRVLEISQSVKLPYTVMGGIHGSNIQQVLDIGARRIAMVTEITQAKDISARVTELRRVIRINV